MPIQTATRFLLATLAVVLTAAPAGAQIFDLNPVIPTKSVISGSEQGEIDSFIAEHTKRIASGEAGAVIQSRNALLKPLESAGVTRAFRQAYGTAALPIVKTLVASTDPVSQMAGLRLAGKLGTDDGTNILLDKISDPDEGTRFFVVTSLGETMASLSSNAASLSTETAADAIEALGGVIVSAPSAAFADAAVRALAAATRITQPAMASTRSLAIVTLAESVGDRLHGLRAANPDATEEMVVALRACGAVRDAVIQAQIQTSPASATAAVRLGADCVGYVFSRVRSGATASAGSNVHEVKLLGAAENAIYYGRVALREASPPQTNLFEQLENGNEREFNFRAAELVGPESSIVSTLGVKRDRFIRPPADD